MAPKTTLSSIRQHPLSLRTTVANDDSLTDSAMVSDASNIPKPSPQGSRPAPTARPRRAIGNTKTLKAAWDHSASARQNAPVSSSAHFATSKGPPPQASRRNSAPLQPKRRSSTPSPPRPATGDSLASPDYSSPPKGLEDVYQRIADEENLAAQEGAISEEEASDSAPPYSRDQARPDRLRHSSPVPLRNSIRNSPPPRSIVDRIQEAEDKENRLEGDTGATRASGMSFLENMTDQMLAAKLTPHAIDRARDRARLERALQKDSPIFSMNRSREPLTEENLQRRSGREGGQVTQDSSGGSVSSGRLDAPLNVPRSWGSKAKPQKHWLKRIYSPNGTTTRENDNNTPIDWTAAAADVPLPSVEGSSSTPAPSSNQSTPGSVRPQTSLDRIRQWEMNDFTEKSLPVSQSPPVRQRNTALDEIRDREIESLERRAVATNRIEQLRERESREGLRRPRASSVGVNPVIDDTPYNVEDRAEADADDDGDTPTTALEDPGQPNGTAMDESKENRRPTLLPEDSHDSLRRLARALSDSPRPTSPSINGSSAAKVTNGDLSVGLPSHRDEAAARRVGKAVDQTPAAPGAWTDTILLDTAKTQKPHSVLPKYLKTPHVTGGWVDTPVPVGKRPASVPSVPVFDSIAEEDKGAGADTGLAAPKSTSDAAARSHSDSEAVKTEPTQQHALSVPRSALGGLIERAKRTRAESPERNDTLNVGDATLDSLEDLLTLDATEMTTLIRMGAMTNEMKPPENAVSLGTEGELLERLGTKLDRLRNNIHDARKGISKLEHQVSHSDNRINSDDRPPSKGPCRACGCPGGSLSSTGWSPTDTSSKVYLALPLPRILHDRQPDQWISRPTPLGYVFFALSVWYCAEKMTCAYYCKPLYASFYHRPLEPEPFPGRALPTMLWRWFLRPWFWPLWAIAWPFIKAIGIMLGVWDGFVDVPLGSGVESALGYSWDHTNQGNLGTGLDLSMMNDEFL